MDYLLHLHVTEYFVKSGAYPREINQLQALARDYIFRAKGLICDDDSQSSRTAIMLSFEALEMFFYSVLNQYSGATSFTNPKNGYTIGLDAATKKILPELALKGITLVPHPRHGDILSLKLLRNEIVHRGGDVNQKDALDKVNFVFDLISYYSKLTVGFDLTS